MSEIKEQRIICELDFLKIFFEKFRNTPRSFDSLKTDQKWLALYESLYESHLCLDSDTSGLFGIIEEEVKHYNGNTESCPLFKLVKRLLDKGKLENNQPRLSDLTIEDVSSEDLTSMYLVSDDAKLKQMTGDSIGVYVLPVDSCLEVDDYCKITKRIRKNKNIDWNKILKNSPAINSLIIMDRYIVASADDIKNNLFPIIDALIPNSLKIPFHLTLMTKVPQTDDIKELYDSIILHLKKVKPSVHVDLEIHNCTSGDFHDRAILSTNLYISCGSGFNLRRDNGSSQHTTNFKMSLVGICNERGEKIEWDTYYRNAFTIANNRPSYPCKNNNRMFDSFQQ